MASENVSSAGFVSDEGGQCSRSKGFEATAFLLGCGLATVLANAVVLYVAAIYVQIRRAPYQAFVVSMTVGDLLFGVCFELGSLVIECLPGWSCGVFFVVTWTSQIVSVFSLLLLNVERVATLLRHCRLSVRSALTQTTLVWTTVLTLTTATYYSPLVRKSHDRHCHVYFSPVWVHLAITIVCYVLPIGGSLLLSVYVGVKTQLSVRFLSEVTDAADDETGAGRTNNRRTKIMFGRVAFVFSSTVWTALTFLPYRIAYLVHAHCVQTTKSGLVLDEDEDELAFGVSDVNRDRLAYSLSVGECMSNDVRRSVTHLFYLLLMVSVFVNPIITIITQPVYRRGVCALYKRLFTRGASRRQGGAGLDEDTLEYTEMNQMLDVDESVPRTGSPADRSVTAVTLKKGPLNRSDTTTTTLAPP